MSSTTSVASLEKKDAHQVTLQPVAEDKLHEVEVGYDIYQETKDDLQWSKPEEGRILRKIDLWILPIFCMTQGLAFLDKTALNYGNLFGMKADLHVTGSQFSWFASAFYIGYLVAEEPANILLQRYPTGKVMGIVCFLWGIVVIPGLGLMTPFWWRLQEQPYCFNGVAGIVGDFLAYGLGHVNHTAVPAWALIFLVLGGFTTLWGVYIFFFLPDTPVSAHFLDQRQKAIAVKRVAENRTGIKNKEFKVYQMKEAFRDPKTYLLFVASIAAQIPNGVVSNFSSIIISSMGFTKFQTTLLDIPSSVLQITSLVGSGYLAGRFKNSRAIMMFVGNSTCIIAAACLTYGPSDQKWGRLVAFWFTSFQSVGFSLSLVMVSANVGGFTKRQVVTALTFIGYCVSLYPDNIAGPHVLLDSEESTGYPTATKSMMAGYVVKTSCHIMLGLYMWNSNRLRNNAASKLGTAVPEAERARRAEEAGMTDITEFENQWFRYVL
ncbi:major facilitator superfamily domain-containing protein [Schizophyllum amplum]|uniref:Major facilitator superfamily domain-containing protein n=1 Tax=Schizophyllum amplum TaxID=97359 RepID=A0A550CWE9_9AGAR|nr:major facilitator superfamily domain-containing protein [Auriculariopsis ampla]